MNIKWWSKNATSQLTNGQGDSWSKMRRQGGRQAESEKPMSHGGIAAWKVFARIYEIHH